MSIETLTTLFGWVCVINIGLLTLTTLAILSLRQTISRIHSKMFGLAPKDLSSMYFNYLANFKVLILVFNIAPYIALKIVG